MACAKKGCRPWRRAAGQGTEHGGVRTAQSHHSTGVKHGQIQGNVWRKRLYASKHFLRKTPDVAVNLEDLDAAERCGAELLCVVDVETNRTYLASLAVIRKHGLELDRGFGLQVALPLHRWHCFGADAAPAVQLGLGLEVPA